MSSTEERYIYYSLLLKSKLRLPRSFLKLVLQKSSTVAQLVDSLVDMQLNLSMLIGEIRDCQNISMNVQD